MPNVFKRCAYENIFKRCDYENVFKTGVKNCVEKLRSTDATFIG